MNEWVRVFKRRMKADSHYALRCHLNKNDFRCRRNFPMSLSGWRILAGRLFQSCGPAAAKLRSTNRVLVRGTQHVSISADLDVINKIRCSWMKAPCRPGGPTRVVLFRSQSSDIKLWHNACRFAWQFSVCWSVVPMKSIHTYSIDAFWDKDETKMKQRSQWKKTCWIQHFMGTGIQ